MIVLTWRNLWCLSAGKNQLHPSFLLDIAKILQTCYFRYLGKPGYTHPKWYNQLVEKLCLKTVCRQKTALSPSFSGDIVKIHKPILLGNLGMYGYANPKICMPKTNFIMHFFFWDITFYRILQFDWVAAFWPITQEPEFCQIWDWWWNISTNISFHFGLFPGKINHNIFQKTPKNLFRPFCTLFLKSGQK